VEEIALCSTGKCTVTGNDKLYRRVVRDSASLMLTPSKGRDRRTAQPFGLFLVRPIRDRITQGVAVVDVTEVDSIACIALPESYSEVTSVKGSGRLFEPELQKCTMRSANGLLKNTVAATLIRTFTACCTGRFLPQSVPSGSLLRVPGQ
jgi:hypothetical protein